MTATAPPRASAAQRYPSLLVSVPPADQQVPLPGCTWPEAAVEQDARLRTRRRARASSSSKLPPVGALLVGIRETTVREVDLLLDAWQHPLGGVARRPFGRMAFVLEAFSAGPVAVAVSASTPNTTVHAELGLHRYNTVELARIARSDPAATLAALRLWRSYLAPMWFERSHDWKRPWDPLVAAVSYSLPGTPSSRPDMGSGAASQAGGDGVYRRDGWKRIKRGRVNAPGARSRNQPSATNRIADGQVGLWVWPYQPLALTPAVGGG